jgi:hypothetical protein
MDINFFKDNIEENIVKIQYKDIKIFSINPGPMQNEKEYAFHAKLMNNVIDNYQNYKSDKLYSIRDGVSNDVVEEFMKSFKEKKSKKLI